MYSHGTVSSWYLAIRTLDFLSGTLSAFLPPHEQREFPLHHLPRLLYRQRALSISPFGKKCKITEFWSQEGPWGLSGLSTLPVSKESWQHPHPRTLQSLPKGDRDGIAGPEAAMRLAPFQPSHTGLV